MRVQMRTSVTGTRDGQDWPGVGGVIDLPDGEARDMIGAGLAVEVAVARKAPTAAAPKPRTAKPPRAESRGV